MRSKLSPFAALLPKAEHAAALISPPYDVIDVPQARQLAADNPYSLLHITRAEIDLPESVDPYDASVYERAMQNLQRFQQQGWLQCQKPGFYLYRLVEKRRQGEHVQTGVVGVASVDDYEQGRIKQHEQTRLEKETDRVKLADALGAHAEPVLLVHCEHKAITEITARELQQPPLFDLQDHAGVRHLLWPVQQTERLQQAFANLDALYIADGHHRSAAARRLREIRRERNPNHQGDEAYNYFPAVVFPENEVTVFEYNWSGDPAARPLSKYQMHDIIKVADGQGILPPKSTWFSPKLTSGLFIYTF